jgi:DnaJ-class molecular chaperone
LGSRINWVEAPEGEQMDVTCVVCGGSGEVEEVPDGPTDRDDDRDGTGSAIVTLPSVRDRIDPRECRDCLGTGIRQVHLGGRLSNQIAEVCRRCNATGWERSEAA